MLRLCSLCHLTLLHIIFFGCSTLSLLSSPLFLPIHVSLLSLSPQLPTTPLSHPLPDSTLFIAHTPPLLLSHSSPILPSHTRLSLTALLPPWHTHSQTSTHARRRPCAPPHRPQQRAAQAPANRSNSRGSSRSRSHIPATNTIEAHLNPPNSQPPTCQSCNRCVAIGARNQKNAKEPLTLRATANALARQCTAHTRHLPAPLCYHTKTVVAAAVKTSTNSSSRTLLNTSWPPCHPNNSNSTSD